MKRFLACSLFLLALPFVANATPTWATLSVGAYSGDTSAGGDAGEYTAYFCTKAAAEKAFGGSSTSAIENYLASNFSTEIPTGGSDFGTASWYDNQYTFDLYVNPTEGFSSTDYIAIAFYGEEAYRVFGLGSAALNSGSLVFDDTENTSYVGSWKEATAPVPEPTSGLLVLLGIAGLALKRRKA